MAVLFPFMCGHRLWFPGVANHLAGEINYGNGAVFGLFLPGHYLSGLEILFKVYSLKELDTIFKSVCRLAIIAK